MSTTRRDFLKLLGLGAGVTAAGLVLPAEVEPVRRWWQVGRGAPVGAGLRRIGSTDLLFSRPDDPGYQDTVWLSSEHGFTYSPEAEALALHPTQQLVVTRVDVEGRTITVEGVEHAVVRETLRRPNLAAANGFYKRARGGLYDEDIRLQLSPEDQRPAFHWTRFPRG